MGRLEVFQEDNELVLEKLWEGAIDHVEVVSRVVETQFFRTFLGNGAIQKLAESYPSPRKKHDVPLWLYLSSQLTLRLHGASGFASLPYVMHCGGLRDALEQGQVQRKVDPETQRGFLEFQGYNEKNSSSRATPCDQDYVRKLARDTKPEQLEAWYGTAVAPYFREIGAYDREGIFFIDGSYLFVPDNPKYELSRVGYFDEHNHPVSSKKIEELPGAKRRRIQRRRYYQMVGLSHSNRNKDYLIYAGSRVLREGHEIKALLPLVDTFCSAVGKGVLKILVIDRGFIDGAAISKIKLEYKSDVLVPLKGGMDITNDAWKLAEHDEKPWEVWVPPAPQHVEPPDRPEHIRSREKKRQETVAKKKAAAGGTPEVKLERVELKVIPQMELWQECRVPLDVILMREYMSDGSRSQWGLMTTQRVDDPLRMRELYSLRPQAEEGWRQTKCYWDMSRFRSTSFPLITSQVVFILLAYSLLQIFLLKSERGELAKATRERLLAELLPDGEKIAAYWQNHVGYFGVAEYSEILLSLSEGARRRLQGTMRRLRKAQSQPPVLRRRSS
jgi:hypothetical protein